MSQNDARECSQVLEPSFDRDRDRNTDFLHREIDPRRQIRLLKIARSLGGSTQVECHLQVENVSDLSSLDYAALSYSWGEARTDKDIYEISVDGQPFWVRENLWTFLCSAQSFDIGMPIYIDAICLNQRDVAERGEQVKLMSEVYKNANHAHVWLGLPDPRQEPYLRDLQTSLANSSHHSTWRIDSFVGLSYLCSRNYWRRLWIVQELLLSNMATLHCGSCNFLWNDLAELMNLPLSAKFSDSPEDVTWWDVWKFSKPEDYISQHRIEERLFEGWQYALRLFDHRSKWSLKKGRHPGPEAVVTQSNGILFHEAVSDFKQQQCREPRDKIFALVGLLDTDGKNMVAPNYESSLEDVFIKAAAAGIVSRWRKEAGPRNSPHLEYDNRIFCDVLYRTLGLAVDGMQTRVSQAMAEAVSYIDNLSTQPTPPYGRPEDTLSLGQSYTIQESAQNLPPIPDPIMEHTASETPLQRSLKLFMSNLSNIEREDFAGTGLAELKITIVAIQNKQRAISSLQNMTRLRAFLDITDLYSELLDICVGERNTAAFIWGPLRLLLRITVKKPEAFDGVLALYERLGENIPPLARTKCLPNQTGQQAEIVGAVFRNIFDFHRLALGYFKKPAWQQLFSSSWAQLQAKLSAFVQDIEKHNSLVHTQAGAVEAEEARQGRLENNAHFSELLEQAKQGRLETEENFRKLDALEVVRRRTHLFNWLCAPDYASDHEHRRTMRRNTPESGQWLLKNARFRAWFDSKSVSSPLLWVTGKPGAGKSVLASLVVDEALDLPGTTTLFFYCNHDDPEKNTFLGMARSILHQLLMGDETLLMYLFEVASKRGDPTLRTIKMAKEMLTTCLKAVGRTYIIIDGIDECQPSEQQQHIAKFWMNYVENSSSDPEPSRCALFGQDDDTTRPLFCKLPTVRIQGIDHDKDIASYCLATANTIPWNFGMSPGLKALIVKQTSERAHGMFLFARIVMAILSLQVTLEDLEKEMRPDVFPKGLDEAYGRIVDRILVRAPPSYGKHAKRVLSWVACATRLLKWREIQAAASIDLDNQTVDYERRQLNVDLKALCGSLVEELANGDVTFAHATVKQYLLKKNFVDADAEHTSLTELCLNYFSLPAFTEASSDDELHEDIISGTFAFVEYASNSWTTHLEQPLEKAAELGITPTLTEALENFFDLHWRQPRKKSKPTKRIQELSDNIADLAIHERVRDSMASIHCLMSTNLSNTEAVQTSDIFAFINRVRSATERLASQSENSDSLHQFYGPQLYKCPRIYCKWFHEGFKSAEERKSHVEKHERSHYCTTGGCVYATFGYPTAKELEKHIAEVHTVEEFPDAVDEREMPAEQPDVVMNDAPTDVPPTVEEPAAPERQETVRRQPRTEPERPKEPAAKPVEPGRRRRRGPVTYQCEHCPKHFTRAFGLQSHMRTHTNELPFECTVCGKKFARQRDRKRHEELHTGEKKFVCLGTLKRGGHWGCSRRFARADALARHFRSEAGRVCIQPMFDEEAAERQRKVQEQQREARLANEYNIPGVTLPNIDQMSTSYDMPTTLPGIETMFPAALLQQFPALANANLGDPSQSNTPSYQYQSSNGNYGGTTPMDETEDYHSQTTDFGSYGQPSSSNNTSSYGRGLFDRCYDPNAR